MIATITVLLLLSLAGSLAADSASPPRESLRDLNLSEAFIKKMEDRAIIDAQGARLHRLESEPPSPVQKYTGRPRQTGGAIRMLRPVAEPAVLEYRLAQGESLRAFHGYLAPILALRTKFPPVTLSGAPATAPAKLAAAENIRTNLARAGLLPTLARTLELLGAEGFAAAPKSAERQLVEIGFPTDLLAFFQPATGAGRDFPGWMAHLAGRLAKGETSDGMRSELAQARFHFARSNPYFMGWPENGESRVGLIRAQLGGGYRNGVVTGGSLHVAEQLVAALPDANFIFTVPESFAANVRALALSHWPIIRAGRVTMIAEKTPVAAWAQDNGKAGVLPHAASGVFQPATLAPRYASQGEVNSAFYPGESYMMDGIESSGHPVIHSPLLFQGGNLMIVRDPASNERILLLSETEVYRNVALGLSESQVLEAFRLEFGVDKSVVLGAVSYHLDYDLTMRSHDGRLQAFVNDPAWASRLILERAATALSNLPAVATNALKLGRQALQKGDLARAAVAMEAALRPFRNESGAYRDPLPVAFATGDGDSAGFNFRCFLAAIDHGCSLAADPAGQPEERRAYLEALRALDAARRQQQEQLRALGWKIVAVPSMPDLHESLNYLNGIHTQDAFLMPALGGFYSSLDTAAEQAFRAELGPDVRLVRILNGEIQRLHGGIHCVAAAYPPPSDPRPAPPSTRLGQ